MKNKGTTFFLRETHIPMPQPLCEGYRDNLWELVSFFCYKESRNWAQVIGLGSMCPYPLSHLASPPQITTSGAILRTLIMEFRNGMGKFLIQSTSMYSAPALH